MNWKKQLMRLVTWINYRAFVADTKKPQKARQRLWSREIVPLLKNSSFWGEKFKQQPLLSLNEMPVTEYADYESSLQVALNESVQPLNGEKILFWSETSGTTGGRKYFPITLSFQKQFQRTMAPYFYSLIRRFPFFLRNKILYLAAYNVNETSAAGIPVGWISYYNYCHLPAMVRSFYALPVEVLQNSELFDKWAPVYALAVDLSAIFSVTPMVCDTFFTKCVVNFHEYYPYLIGEKKLPDYLPPLNLSSARLSYLQALFVDSTLSFNEIWPGLAFVGCWVSGLCEPYAEKLQQRLGATPLVDGTYSATEGWMTVPLTDKGGVLHPGAHIVEFIEEHEGVLAVNIKQCWELEVGKFYEVILTTAMGFVRYRLKDVVKCTGFFNQSPVLQFSHKVSLLKLSECAFSELELREMVTDIEFFLAPHWYFATNQSMNRLILVTDDESSVSSQILLRMHTYLLAHSEVYANGVASGLLLPVIVVSYPKHQLLANMHAQTKPKLISVQLIEDSLLTE